MNKTIAGLYGIFFGLLTAGAAATLDYAASQLYPSAQALVFDPEERVAHLFGAVVFAPLVETVIFQVGVIELTNHWFTGRRKIPLILSTLIFSALHLFNSVAQAGNMILFGAALAMIYGAFRKYSVAHAFTATFATHTSHNLLCVLAIVLFPQLG